MVFLVGVLGSQMAQTVAEMAFKLDCDCQLSMCHVQNGSACVPAIHIWIYQDPTSFMPLKPVVVVHFGSLFCQEE